MSSWEEIANEVAPLGAAPPVGLVTGAMRGSRARRGSLGEAFGVARYLHCQTANPGDSDDQVWQGRVESNYAGCHYRVQKEVTYYDETAEGLGTRLQAALKNPPSRMLDGLSVSDLLFMDIETMGLSDSLPVFLIGTMSFPDGMARLDLHLARALDEEKAVLTAFGSQLRSKMLVTFNGKSFDWPYLVGRARRWQVPLPEPQGHFDLLFAARRQWRSKLPNCRLQTLEMGICGRGREGDIPSAQIPARYRDFLDHSAHTPLDSGAAHLLAPVLFHNALDVLTMAELICHLAES